MAELGRDPLFTGLTRPQMFAGVSYSFFIVNGIVTVELFLMLQSAWTLVAAPVMHVAAYLACAEEPRFFDLWLVKATRCPRVRNHDRWGCNSYAP